jgi:hypothetical protein
MAEAFWAPRVSGLVLGMISAIRLGRRVRSSTSHRKSCRTRCTG